MNFFNQQNKRHFALFQQDGAAEWREEKIHWSDVLFNRHSQQLNKRLTKISPRRGKKQAEAAIQRVFNSLEPDMSDLFNMIEAIEEHEE